MTAQPSAIGSLSSQEEPRRWRKKILIAIGGVFAVVVLQAMAFLPGALSQDGFCRGVFGVPLYLIYLPVAGMFICFVALRLRLRLALLLLAAMLLNASCKSAETYELMWSSALSPVTVYFREVIARYADIVTGAACKVPYQPIQFWAAEAYGYGATAVGLLACAAYSFWPRRKAAAAEFH
jgi:hypothetical protein